jgi:hypothetical protein
MSFNLTKLIEELQEAGLWGLPVSYAVNGRVEYIGNVTTQQRQQIEAVIAAHNAAAADLAEARKIRQAHINRRREEFIANRVTVNGITYDTDDKSVANLSAAILFMFVAQSLGVPTPTTVSWRDANNVDRDLTFADLFALGTAIFTRVRTAHNMAREVKDRIEQLTDPSRIQAEDWPE